MNIKKLLTTIDTHTAGGPTRIITGGLPPLPGKSVAEKAEHFQAHHDGIRKLLVLEPRGHRDMYGAVVTESLHPDADVGAFFFTASGYLPACVHSAIGVATAGLSTGTMGVRPDGTIRMEVPAGVISLSPQTRDGDVASIAIQTNPAFVHTPSAQIKLDDARSINASIVFSGVFFALVDIGQLDVPRTPSGALIGPENAQVLRALGVQILDKANQQIKVHHPQNPAATAIALVMFYEPLEDNHARDIVIGVSGAIDRSPCGAGTGAMVTNLFTMGSLQANQEYVLESFLGTRFTGRIVEAATVGSFHGAVPEIRGSAYITGMHQFVLEVGDPLNEGLAM